jgi:uncharacterized protein (UPF0276 family)
MYREQQSAIDGHDPIPARAGIGLKAQHYRDILASRPDVGWVELHTENYMGDGGAPHRYLETIAERYPLSFHGVGLSLGSAEPLSRSHLQRLREVVERYRPGLVSEHLSWSISGGVFLNDLLPLPYTTETLDVVCNHVAEVQDLLGRQLLLENPSTYLRYKHSAIPETDFLMAVADRTGCGVLLDVNNVFVSASNHNFDPAAYLAALETAPVKEIHLAGHHVNEVDGRCLLIDDHGSQVIDPVWALFADATTRFGHVPTLIEWDTRVPTLDVLVAEAHKADAIMMADGGPMEDWSNAAAE